MGHQRVGRLDMLMRPLRMLVMSRYKRRRWCSHYSNGSRRRSNRSSMRVVHNVLVPRFFCRRSIIHWVCSVFRAIRVDADSG